MFTYRNTETGTEFQSTSQCSGKDWVLVAPSPAAKMKDILSKMEVPEEKTKRAIKRKKDGNGK